MSTAPAPATEEPLVLRHDEGGIVTLTLNRPGQFNALSASMLDALQSALDGMAADPSARVVVIAGAGRAFCAGHDLKEMLAGRSREFLGELFGRCGRVMQTVMALPQPVIARVHGVATAAGCQLVASCDLAVAAEQARFAVSGINVGLFCATPSVALGRNLPRKQAMEMLLTGDFIDARTALERGLVNRVVPAEQLDAEVQALAAKIIAKPASALAAGKRMFYRQLEVGVDDAYRLACEAMVCNALEDDCAEGITAFMEKRPPKWGGG